MMFESLLNSIYSGFLFGTKETTEDLHRSQAMAQILQTPQEQREKQSFQGYKQMKLKFPGEIEFMRFNPINRIRTMTREQCQILLSRLVRGLI